MAGSFNLQPIKTNMKKLLLLFLIALAGCSNSNEDTVVIISTEYGEMTALLYDETPKHKANFIELAEDGYFNGTLFHRVIKNFMIQGGDPNTKDPSKGEFGSGGPGYTVPAEFQPHLFHKKGALSAARQDDSINPNKESSGSQFYVVHGQVWDSAYLVTNEAMLYKGLNQILQHPKYKAMGDSLQAMYNRNPQEYLDSVYKLAPLIAKETNLELGKSITEAQLKAYTSTGGTPHLDGQYTVFGQVVKGLEVLDKIAAEQTNPSDRPLKDIPMKVITKRMSKQEIEKEFGWVYPTSKQ